jgi:hypothetical protein
VKIEDMGDPKKIVLFVAGMKETALRIDLDNCEKVFATLKPKVAENCVIWFGGCNIAANTDFCLKAANAAGCPVVAPYMVLPNQKFPRGHVDMLDM